MICTILIISDRMGILNRAKNMILPKIPRNILQRCYQSGFRIFDVFGNTSETKIEQPNVETGIR